MVLRSKVVTALQYSSEPLNTNFLTLSCPSKYPSVQRKMLLLSRYLKKYLILTAFILGGDTVGFKHNILQYFFYEKFSDA